MKSHLALTKNWKQNDGERNPVEMGRRTKQEWSCYIILRDYKSETFKEDSNDHLIIKGPLLKKIMATRYKLSIGVATDIKPLLHGIISEENK